MRFPPSFLGRSFGRRRRRGISRTICHFSLLLSPRRWLLSCEACRRQEETRLVQRKSGQQVGDSPTKWAKEYCMCSTSNYFLGIKEQNRHAFATSDIVRANPLTALLQRLSPLPSFNLPDLILRLYCTRGGRGLYTYSPPLLIPSPFQSHGRDSPGH